MPKEENLPVLVVGGGVSGFSAARFLSLRGKEVLVLEAQDRVGGRTLTLKDDGTTDSRVATRRSFGWADLGASYVGPTQDHVLRLCKELGLKTFPCRSDQDMMHFSKPLPQECGPQEGTPMKPAFRGLVI